jgi:hypothetical protein
VVRTVIANWMAIPAGVLGGALFLVGLWLLARKRALKFAERAGVVFLRSVAFLAFVHGVGLVLVTACVLFSGCLFFGTIAAEDRAWMIWFIIAGVVLVILAGATLRWTGWFPRARRAGE